MAYVSTETTRRVRSELKQRFPNLKFSVSKKDGTLRVRIMAGDLDFRDIWEDIPDNKQYWKRYGNPKPHFDGYVSINTHHPNDYNPKYTDLFKQIISIMKGTEWFDNSDPQIDYFSTAYYLKLSVGKWNKPYQYTGTPRMDDMFRRFRGEEFEAQLSEYLYKCDACGHITDVRFSDVYSDKYCREACARGRPEKCRGSCGKNGWDVEFTGVYHAGLSQRPSIDTMYGVIISCKDCGIGFYGDARWELYDELPDTSQAEGYGAEGEGMDMVWVKSRQTTKNKWGVGLQGDYIHDSTTTKRLAGFFGSKEEAIADAQIEMRKYNERNEVGGLRRTGIGNYNEKVLYPFGQGVSFIRNYEAGAGSKWLERLETLYQYEPIPSLTSRDFDAEGEDMSLKDSAKLGFGLGAGLLGFKVALLGASALVGGLLLNRKE